jgi:mannose-6-phosphate isomerase
MSHAIEIVPTGLSSESPNGLPNEFASDLSHPNVTRVRAWGTVTTLDESDRYRINRIEIRPGESMCMQMHHHRSEHWVIVSGTATVTCGEKNIQLIPKQSTYVPMHTAHQVRNEGVIPLVMIEVQNGEYLGEDDIIRL